MSVGKSQRQGKLHGLNRVQTAGIRMFMLQFSCTNVLVVNPKINRILAARNSDHVDLSVWICFIISSFLSSENRQDPSRLPSLALAPRGFALRCFGRRYNGGRSEVLQRKLGAGHGSMRSVWTVFTTVAYLCYDDVYADSYALFVDVAVPSKSSVFVSTD